MTKKKKTIVDKLAALARLSKSDSEKLGELEACMRDVAGQIEDLKVEVAGIASKMQAKKAEYDLAQPALRGMLSQELTALNADFSKLKEKQDKLFDSKNRYSSLIREFELKAVADAEKAIDLEETIENLIVDKEEGLEEDAERRKLLSELDGLKYESEGKQTLPGAFENAEESELSDEVKQTLAALQHPEAPDVSDESDATDATAEVEPPVEE